MVDVSKLRIPTDELHAWNQGDEDRTEDGYLNPYETRRLRIAYDRGFRGLPIEPEAEHD